MTRGLVGWLLGLRRFAGFSLADQAIRVARFPLSLPHPSKHLSDQKFSRLFVVGIFDS